MKTTVKTNLQKPIDIIDELTYEQKKKLSASLKQENTGKTVTNEDMKTEMKQWLTK
jgi:hypothetical protein